MHQNGGQKNEEKSEAADEALLADDNGQWPVDREESDPRPQEDEEGLRYTLTQIPPVPVCVFVALQHVLVTLASSLTMSAVISDTLCADDSHVIRAQLFATTLAMSGMCTILQTLLGVRLPVFQGPSSSFLVPLVGMSQLPSWKCSDQTANTTLPYGSGDFLNTTSLHSPSATYSMEEKLQQLSGSLMIASLVEIVIGGFGVIKPLMRLIGPLTVAPTIGLIGLSLFRLPVMYAKYNPAIALASALLVIVFALHMAKIQVRLPACNKGGKRLRLPVFQLFPILLAMAVMWALCGVLTAADVFPDDREHVYYLSRTDARVRILQNTPWFYVPYPGQYGPPSVSLAAILGFCSSVVASLVESVGDYLAAAKCCQVTSPPNHAISRGILVEGIGSFLSGAVGAAHATTSYSGNIAMLRLTRTASRCVLVLAGCTLIGISLIGKIGAALATLPPPIMGGVLMVMLGLLAALGMSTLSYADMSSNRNLLVTGTAFISGLTIPEFVGTHRDMLLTGNASADQVIHIVLETPMFLGGFVAVLLDNTVPGTDAERGLLHWKTAYTSASAGNDVTGKDDGKGSQAQATGDVATRKRASSLNGGRLKSLSEEDVYSFSFLKNRLNNRLWRYVPFLPPDCCKAEKDAECNAECVTRNSQTQSFV